MSWKLQPGQQDQETKRSKVCGTGSIQFGEFNITQRYVYVSTVSQQNADIQSISSTRGVGLLQAFLYQVHQHHSQPPTYPALKERIVSSCAYRVSASGLITNGRNTPLSTSTYPSPPGTPPLRHLALMDRLRQARYKLEERRLGAVGRDWTTLDAFERLVREQDVGIGQVWLDGQSVSHIPYEAC